MVRVVAQLGCDHGLHQHVPLRVQSVPVVGGGNVLVDTAMKSYIHAYIHTYIYIHACRQVPLQRQLSRAATGHRNHPLQVTRHMGVYTTGYTNRAALGPPGGRGTSGGGEERHKTTRSYDHSGVFAHAKWQHISIVTHKRPPARGAAFEHAVPINCKHRQTYNLTLPAHPHAAGCLQLHRYLGAAQPADPPQRPDRQPLLPPHSLPPLPPLFPLGRHEWHRR